jgi:hypothetical protein
VASGGQVVEVLLVDEHGAVCGRQPVAALARLGSRIVDGQEPGNGLLLEPLAHVTLGRAGADGELPWRRVAAVGERPVEAEPGAYVDGSNLLRGDHGRKQALDEGVVLCGFGRRDRRRGAQRSASFASCLSNGTRFRRRSLRSAGRLDVLVHVEDVVGVVLPLQLREPVVVLSVARADAFSFRRLRNGAS